MNKMPLKWLTENWGLKLTAFVFSAMLWFLVTNINDPVITVRFYNIPVTLRNTNAITERGEVYEILENTDVVNTVYISARRKIAEAFTRDNILAVADMELLEQDGTVPISLSVNRNSGDVVEISGSSDRLKLGVEERKTKTLSLTANATGTLTEGYIVGSVTPEQNLIRISGPASRIDRVASASADVDVTGFTSDIGTQAEISLYDENGTVISDSMIAQNIQTVRVQVTIMQTKQVQLSFKTRGTPAPGYLVTGRVEAAPDTVEIAGRPAVIADVSAIEIDDPALDVTGRSETLVTSVSCSGYLPAGVSFADSNFDGMVSVTVTIDLRGTRTIAVPVERINVTNVPAGYTVTVNDPDGMVQLQVSGLSDRLEALTADEISGMIDGAIAVGAAEEEEANEEDAFPTATVFWTLPNGVQSDSTVTVPVRIVRSGVAGDGTDDGNAAGGDSSGAGTEENPGGTENAEDENAAGEDSNPEPGDAGAESSGTESTQGTESAGTGNTQVTENAGTGSQAAGSQGTGSQAAGSQGTGSQGTGNQTTGNQGTDTGEAGAETGDSADAGNSASQEGGD